MDPGKTTSGRRQRRSQKAGRQAAAADRAPAAAPTREDPNFSLGAIAQTITTHAHLGAVLAAVVVTYHTQGPAAARAHLGALEDGLRSARSDPDFLALVEAMRAGIEDVEHTEHLSEIIW